MFFCVEMELLTQLNETVESIGDELKEVKEAQRKSTNRIGIEASQPA